MSRSWLFRVLLAVALAGVTGIGDARAQCTTNLCPPPSPTPTPTPTPIPIPTPTPTPFTPPTIPITTPAPTDNLRLVLPGPVSSHRDNSGWYALGGVVTTVVIGLVVKSIFNNSTVATSPQRTLPPRQTVTQFQGNFPSLQGLRGTGGAGGAGGGAGGGAAVQGEAVQAVEAAVQGEAVQVAVVAVQQAARRGCVPGSICHPRGSPNTKTTA